MATISRDTVRVEITAVDKTKSGFRSLTSGLDNVQKTARRLQTTLGNLGGRRLLSGIRSVSRELTSIAGLGGIAGAGGIAAGIGLLARNGLIAGDSLAKTADVIGTTTEELGRLRFAIGQTSEITEKGLDKSLQRLQKRLSEVSAGYGTAARAVEELNLDASDLTNGGVENAFLTLSDAISNLENKADRLRLTDLFFGREGQLLLTSLDEGSSKLRELGDTAVDLGLIFDRNALGARIEQANDAIDRLKRVVSAAGISVALELSPRIQGLTQSFLDWIKESGGVQVVVANIIQSAGDAIARIASFTSGLVGLFGGVERALIGIRLSVDSTIEAVLKSDRFFNKFAFGSKREERLQRDIDLNTTIADIQDRRIKLSERLNELDSGNSTPEIAGIQETVFSSGPDQAIAQIQTDDGVEERRQAAVELQQAAERKRKEEFDKAELKRKAEIDAAQRKVLEEKERLEEGARVKAQIAEEKRLTAEVAANKVAATTNLQTIRESFDERLRIANEAQRQLDEISSIRQTIGIDSEIEDGLIDSIIAEERRQLDELDRAREEEFSQRQERRSSVLNLSSLIEFDTSTFQTVENGADEIARVFRERVKAINVSVELTSEEKLNAIREAAILREQLKGELQVDVTVNRLTSAADLTGQVLGGFGQLQQSGVADDSQLAQERANQIAQIQSDLNTAIESGNQAEIASQQSKLSALQTIQSREQQIAKKRFENYKKTQKAIALVSTFSAAAQVFQETPGILPIRILAASAAVAAGLANIQAIDRQQFNSGSAGSGSFGSASGTGGSGVSNSQVTDTAAQTQTQRRPTVINLVANPDLPLSYESIVGLVERINEVGEDGVNVRTVAA